MSAIEEKPTLEYIKQRFKEIILGNLDEILTLAIEGEKYPPEEFEETFREIGAEWQEAVDRLAALSPGAQKAMEAGELSPSDKKEWIIGEYKTLSANDQAEVLAEMQELRDGKPAPVPGLTYGIAPKHRLVFSHSSGVAVTLDYDRIKLSHYIESLLFASAAGAVTKNFVEVYKEECRGDIGVRRIDQTCYAILRDQTEDDFSLLGADQRASQEVKTLMNSEVPHAISQESPHRDAWVETIEENFKYSVGAEIEFTNWLAGSLERLFDRNIKAACRLIAFGPKLTVDEERDLFLLPLNGFTGYSQRATPGFNQSVVEIEPDQNRKPIWQAVKKEYRRQRDLATSEYWQEHREKIIKGLLEQFQVRRDVLDILFDEGKPDNHRNKQPGVLARLEMVLNRGAAPNSGTSPAALFRKLIDPNSPHRRQKPAQQSKAVS